MRSTPARDVVPGEPPTTSSAPVVNLESPSRLRGTRSRSAGSARTAFAPTGSSPMFATSTSPAWARPGETTRPSFLAWNVTVRSASTAAPATSPVEASTPEGTSTATTGRPQALMRSIVFTASGRGSPWKPVPKSASITTSAPTGSSVSSASRPASRNTRAAIFPSPPFEPPPQTTAKRRASGKARIAS